MERQSECGLGEGEGYETRKGLIVDRSCEYEITRSYSDRCDVFMRPEA